MTPELLDDLKDMFHPGSHFTAAPIPFSVALTERGVAATASLDAPAHPFGFIFLPLRFVDVSTVAVNYFLLAVQQFLHHLRIMNLGRGHYRRMSEPAGIGA